MHTVLCRPPKFKEPVCHGVLERASHPPWHRRSEKSTADTACFVLYAWVGAPCMRDAGSAALLDQHEARVPDVGRLNKHCQRRQQQQEQQRMSAVISTWPATREEVKSPRGAGERKRSAPYRVIIIREGISGPFPRTGSSLVLHSSGIRNTEYGIPSLPLALSHGACRCLFLFSEKRPDPPRALFCSYVEVRSVAMDFVARGRPGRVVVFTLVPMRA